MTEFDSIDKRWRARRATVAAAWDAERAASPTGWSPREERWAKLWRDIDRRRDRAVKRAAS